MPANHGPFIWYEYASADPARAGEFYHDVVGWTVADSGMPGMNYTILSAADGGIGGLVEQTTRNRPGWTGYVAVANVDATIAAYEKRGGSVLASAVDVPGVGRIAGLLDPDGALLALMTPSSEATWTPDRMRLQGHCGWHELFANDAAKGFDFYSGVFGWEKGDTMSMGEMGIYQIFNQDGGMIGGMMTRSPETPRAHWNFYFNVQGLDAAIARATARGAMTIHGPMQVPGGGWVVMMLDPEKAMFSLLSDAR